jgi:hypothetical protein
LGELLVDRGMLDPADLDFALAIQKRSGRLLGEILVTRHFVSADELAQALAEQHGIRIGRSATGWRVARSALAAEAAADGSWRPLGRLLVECGLITEDELARALFEQKRTGSLLGEALVKLGSVSANDIARTVAAQHGLEPEGDVDASVAAEEQAEDEAVYEVYDVAAPPDSALHASSSFLDATDFAFDLIDEHDPDSVEIVKVIGDTREVVWTYNRDQASEVATHRTGMLDLYGYPVAKWEAGRRMAWRADH